MLNFMPKDHLKLHFIVILNSFVPFILSHIELDYVVIVFYRMLAAFLMLGGFLYFRQEKLWYSAIEAAKLLVSGLLTAAYWSFVILSVRYSNISVALVGMATTSLWISFLEPLIFKTPPKPFQTLLGINAIVAVYVIFHSNFEYGTGLGFGIIGSFFAALVTIFSGRLARTYKPMVITFYQMAGGGIGITLFTYIYLDKFMGQTVQVVPDAKSVMLILFLAFVFSVYAYSVFIDVMKTVSAFVVSLCNNLSPIYGILFTILITDEEQSMSKGFVVGAGMLLFSVFAYPILVHYKNKFATQRTVV